MFGSEIFTNIVIHCGSALVKGITTVGIGAGFIVPITYLVGTFAAKKMPSLLMQSTS